MPIISRKKLAELTGDRIEAINVWIKRGKISHLPNDKKLIDTENPLNAEFIQVRQESNRDKGVILPVPESSKSAPKVSKSVQKKAKSEPKSTEIVTKIPKKVTKSISKAPFIAAINQKSAPKNQAKVPKLHPKEQRALDRQLGEQKAKDQRRVDMAAQKMTLEIENLELGRQQKMLMLNKAAGSVMPVDLVKGVLKRHADAIHKNFEKGIENFVSIVAGSDTLAYVRYLKDAKEILSRCITDAGVNASEEILILVEDYSETLVRGQKKI